MLVLHLSFFFLVCIHLREKTVTDRMSIKDSLEENAEHSILDNNNNNTLLLMMKKSK
jgi:hypothetical protein